MLLFSFSERSLPLETMSEWEQYLGKDTYAARFCAFRLLCAGVKRLSSLLLRLSCLMELSL
jgi:hypothetical protein